MKTTLNFEQANCPTCFGETLDELRRIDGLRAVRGSIAGRSIEIEYTDIALDFLIAAVRDRLHGVAMFANEVRMVPVDPIDEATGCIHRRPDSSALETPHAGCNDPHPPLDDCGDSVTGRWAAVAQYK